MIIILIQYEFLKQEGFAGVDGLSSSDRSAIEEITDLWYDLEGEIPKDKNIFHELFSGYSKKWVEYLRTTSPSWSSVIRGWWLELARIRYNEPARYKKRHIRKDWYGWELDPYFYSGKIFTLPIRGILGLKPQPAEEDYDRFHKELKGMIWKDVFNYDILRLWPREGWGVRDVSTARAKVCAGVFIATEKNIGEEPLPEFCDIYGVSVRTCVFKKASALSDWAVVSDFMRQIPEEVPILLVTISDYDFDGITGVHFGFHDHFKKYYPEVRHLICGVFPFQVPPERLHPGDALYELKKKAAQDWFKAAQEGRVPSDMAPIEYEGKYYGIEMDAVGMHKYLPAIVEKLEEVGCTQEVWTDWAREETFPDVDEVEERIAHAKARDLIRHRQLESMKSKIYKERWRKVSEYDKTSFQVDRNRESLKDIVREEMEGTGKEITEETDFDDRVRPPLHTLKKQVAELPLKPYEEYWDPETKTGFSRKYLVEKLEEGLEEEFEERIEDIEEKVEEEMAARIEKKKAEVLELLEEVRTRSRVAD